MLIKEIKPWGTGSQCLPVPKDILNLVNLEIGDNVQIEIIEGKIIITPVKKESTNLIITKNNGG